MIGSLQLSVTRLVAKKRNDRCFIVRNGLVLFPLGPALACCVFNALWGGSDDFFCSRPGKEWIPSLPHLAQAIHECVNSVHERARPCQLLILLVFNTWGISTLSNFPFSRRTQPCRSYDTRIMWLPCCSPAHDCAVVGGGGWNLYLCMRPMRLPKNKELNAGQQLLAIRYPQ